MWWEILQDLKTQKWNPTMNFLPPPAKKFTRSCSPLSMRFTKTSKLNLSSREMPFLHLLSQTFQIKIFENCQNRKVLTANRRALSWTWWEPNLERRRLVLVPTPATNYPNTWDGEWRRLQASTSHSNNPLLSSNDTNKSESEQVWDWLDLLFATRNH